MYRPGWRGDRFSHCGCSCYSGWPSSLPKEETLRRLEDYHRGLEQEVDEVAQRIEDLKKE